MHKSRLPWYGLSSISPLRSLHRTSLFLIFFTPIDRHSYHVYSPSNEYSSDSSEWQETQRLIAEPVPGISATPYQDNLRYFAVAIEGPSETPYERGVFQLELFLPAD